MWAISIVTLKAKNNFILFCCCFSFLYEIDGGGYKFFCLNVSCETRLFVNRGCGISSSLFTGITREKHKLHLFSLKTKDLLHALSHSYIHM